VRASTLRPRDESSKQRINVSRILVTGAAGVVGGYVAEAFADHELLLTDIVDGFEPLDVADPQAVRRCVLDSRPEVVIHLAAATDVDRCEQEPDLAYRTNAVGTQNVALACKEADAVLVYISTAGVFGGEKAEPYIEFDAPAPANIYGHSKLAGEQIVQTLLDRFYIARAGWMIGGGLKDKKFVGKIMQFIDSGEQHLRAVDDKLGTPTYASDLAGGIRVLLDSGYYGLYHLVNAGGACSRYDVTVELCRILGRSDIAVEPVSSAFFPLPAPRARSEAMVNYKLSLLGIDPMRHWREALEAYVTQELRSPAGVGQAEAVPPVHVTR
jgi:dTDP-4-dehydrorhamnose reductase